jgi:hypothetical protein
MRSEPKMRMPYGPGWEDPDWSPHAEPPDESTAMKRDAHPVDERPVVGSLAQFMEVVKRFATPRRRQASRGAEARVPGPTRRWVMAGGAGFVALAALPKGRIVGGVRVAAADPAAGDEDAAPPPDDPTTRA